MKSTGNTNARERTRRAILEAMADVITDTNGIGFSVQAIANRAGVTHRTIYNHFPTREALCEAFADYADELLSASTGEPPPAIPSIDEIPALAGGLYKLLAQHDRHSRAYVMLMIGNRGPLKTWRGRTHSIEKEVAKRAVAGAPISPRLAAAAVRMFVSTMGWHLLTEQCGLSTDEAATTTTWATQTLLEAATGSGHATSSPRPPQKAKDANRRRRN